MAGVRLLALRHYWAATGDVSFPEWSAMIVRRRNGASVGVALDWPLDLFSV
jgi:hypothetical protein